MLRSNKAFRTVVGNVDQGVFRRPNLYTPTARENRGTTTQGGHGSIQNNDNNDNDDDDDIEDDKPHVPVAGGR